MSTTICDLDELVAAWAIAEREAERALHAWNAQGGASAYAVYRAAADQADAAQDDLAARARGRG